MTKLTTHCLDTFSGKPAQGIKVDVYFVSDKRTKLNSTILNNDGRSGKPLIEGSNFKEGQYELVFFVGDYFKKITDLPKTPFLNEVVIRFGISNSNEHYHVPLLVSPWSYSTYRGS
jgi:5-hydroxyisourate hydrolase